MADLLVPAAAGEPLDPAFDDVGGSLPVTDIVDAVGGDGGQGELTPVDDGSSTDAGYEPPVPPDAAPRSDEPASFAAGQMAEVAAPRANDAMRVLSRMQLDLDLVTEGKRAATYDEVDTAFDNAVTALGIKVPTDADAALRRSGGGAQNAQYGFETVERLSSTDPMPDRKSGYAVTPAPGALLDMVAGGGGADHNADASPGAMSWRAATTSPQSAVLAKSAVSAPQKSRKSGAVQPKAPSAKFTPPLPDERAVALARDWPVPGYPDPNDHRFPLQGDKDLKGARYADGRYSPEGKYRTQQGKKGLVPRPHRGYDLPGKPGDPIGAAADGVVMGFGVAKGWGTYIAVKHPDGYTTVYAHLSSYAKLKIGQAVTRGTIIGAMGNTGDAKGRGTHLHLEVKVTNEGPNGNMTLARDNRTVDPAEWLAGKLHQP